MRATRRSELLVVSGPNSELTTEVVRRIDGLGLVSHHVHDFSLDRRPHAAEPEAIHQPVDAAGNLVGPVPCMALSPDHLTMVKAGSDSITLFWVGTSETAPASIEASAANVDHRKQFSPKVDLHSPPDEATEPIPGCVADHVFVHRGDIEVTVEEVSAEIIAHFGGHLLGLQPEPEESPPRIAPRLRSTLVSVAICLFVLLSILGLVAAVYSAFLLLILSRG